MGKPMDDEQRWQRSMNRGEAQELDDEQRWQRSMNKRKTRLGIATSKGMRRSKRFIRMCYAWRRSGPNTLRMCYAWR